MVHLLHKRVLHLTYKSIHKTREMEERMLRILHQHKEIGAAPYHGDGDDSYSVLCLRCGGVGGVRGGEARRVCGCGVLGG